MFYKEDFFLSRLISIFLESEFKKKLQKNEYNILILKKDFFYFTFNLNTILKLFKTSIYYFIYISIYLIKKFFNIICLIYRYKNIEEIF